MPPKTDPIDASAPQTAPRLTIAPEVIDAISGARYVHNDYVQVTAPYEVEAHIPPIARKELFGDVESWAAYVLYFGTCPESADETAVETESDDKGCGLDEPFLTWSERGLNAILDYHWSDGTPDRCQWIARHDFERSHAWNVWSLLANGKARSQREVLEALEDNQADIVDPIPANLIAVLRTLRSTSSAKAETTLQADGSTKVTWAKETGVKSAELELPSEFRIAIPVLKGHQEPTEEGKHRPVLYSLAVRIRASVDDQAKLSLRLSIPDAERVLEAVYADRVAAAVALLGAGHRLYRAAAV